METIAATQLKLANDNNKLACAGFIQIHFAPSESVRESDLNKVFEVPHDGSFIQVKLVDVLRIPFNRIGNFFTIPATGKEYQEWRQDWVSRYPKTHGNTEMAVYCYRRID